MTPTAKKRLLQVISFVVFITTWMILVFAGAFREPSWIHWGFFIMGAAAATGVLAARWLGNED